jgi:hypothetical protein
VVVRVEALRAACAQSTFCNTWAPPTTDRKLETWGVAWVSFYVPLSLSLLRSLSFSLSGVIMYIVRGYRQNQTKPGACA